MKILVTGDKGFVGTETCKLLEKEGHEVIGYDLMDGYDIRDWNQLESVIQTKKPDRVLHLAAIARFAEADQDPIRCWETNYQGTVNVTELCKKYHIPLVFASTGSAYMPLTAEDIIRETDEIKGNSVYGCSKAFGDLYVETHNPSIRLRYAHLYGPEKRYHGLIGGFLARIEHGIAPVLYGGKQSNDFTYIPDVAKANLLALTAPWDKWNQAYNIGTGEELTAEDAGKMICDIAGYDGEIEKKEQRTVDPQRFFFDVSKAETMLGFKAEYDFKSGLKDMFKD